MSLITVLIIHLFILLLFIIGLFVIIVKYRDIGALVAWLLLLGFYLILFFNEIQYSARMVGHAYNILSSDRYERYDNYMDMCETTLYHNASKPLIRLETDNGHIKLDKVKDYINYYREPVIFVSNYIGDPLEYLNVGLMGDKITLVARDMSQTKYGYLMEGLYNHKNYISLKLGKSNYDYLKNKVERHIRKHSIFVYPEEDKNRGGYELANFKTGIFKISHELGIPIVPIVWDHYQTNHSTITVKPHKITIGQQYKPNNYDNWNNLMMDVREWMNHSLSRMK